MTEIEFAKGMAFLGACLDRDIPQATVEAWFMLLGDLNKRDFDRAIVEVCRNHKFSGLPPVGLIRQAAGVSGGVVDADSAALLAWDKVRTAMRVEGAYKSIQWDDPAIAPAIDTVAGSWPELCGTLTDQLDWKRKAFIDAYKAHRTARTQTSGVSVGILAQDAGRIGFEEPEPVRIGQEPSGTYGFGGDLLALPGPVGDVPRLVDELAKRMPEIVPDEPERLPELTAEEFEERRKAMLHAMKVRYSTPGAA